VKQAN